MLELQNDNLNHNRIWLRLAAQPEDHIYGCGEQFSYFDLRGKRLRYGPVNKALVATNKPMSPGRPTAKKMRAATITGLSSHSLRLSARRSITAMLITVAIRTSTLAPRNTMNWRCGKTKQRCVLNVLTHTFPCWKSCRPAGRQPELPDWIYDGVTLGIQGGTVSVPEETGHHA
ncbi:hypothetical protein ACLB1S_00510 [Escherichia coli]